MHLSRYFPVGLTLLLAVTSAAEAGQLSLRFAGGDEVTLAGDQTAEHEVVWTMGVLDTAKSGAKLTGLSARFNIDDAGGLPASGLTVEDISVLSGWQNSSNSGVPFTESDFYLGTTDPTGPGIAGNGTVFETILATFTIRNNEPLAEPDAPVTLRHSSPGDPLPAADIDAGLWSMIWQQDVVASKQYGLGLGNPGDADSVWDPYHGLETFEPLTVHLIGGALLEPPGFASKNWTWPADFANGPGVQGVNLDRTVPGQISVNITGPALSPLPYLWVACSGRGTIVRIDTVSGAVLGEYRSAPNGRERNPSRTSVDLFGNVFTGNRDEAGDGQGSVVKIGLVSGGTWVNSNGIDYLVPPFDYCTCHDRDGNGKLRTSRGLGNILAWPNNGDGRGGSGCEPALVENAADECILIYQRVNPENVRHVSVTADNDLWVGAQDRFFDRLDGETGIILESFEARDIASGTTSGGYGGLVDGNGVLWSSTQGEEHTLLRYNTLTGVVEVVDNRGVDPLATNTYGLAIDHNGHLWVGQWLAPTQGRVMKLNSDCSGSA